MPTGDDETSAAHFLNGWTDGRRQTSRPTTSVAHTPFLRHGFWVFFSRSVNTIHRELKGKARQLTMSRCAIEGNSYQPTQQCVRAPTPAGRDKTTQRVGRGSIPGIVEGGVSGLYARAAALQTGSPPSRGLHLIGSIQPVRSIRASREDLTRSVGGDSCRSGVSPHRTQAPSRSWPPVTPPSLPAALFWRLSAPRRAARTSERV